MWTKELEQAGADWTTSELSHSQRTEILKSLAQDKHVIHSFSKLSNEAADLVCFLHCGTNRDGNTKGPQ